jgi:hypothetical protein
MPNTRSRTPVQASPFVGQQSLLSKHRSPSSAYPRHSRNATGWFGWTDSQESALELWGPLEDCRRFLLVTGALVGDMVGDLVGAFVGIGALVGDLVGAFVGFFVGDFVGDLVGVRVGAAVHELAVPDSRNVSVTGVDKILFPSVVVPVIVIVCVPPG